MEYLNAEFAKKHWQAIAGGLFGALVLYYLYQHFAGSSGGASSSAGDLSGGSTAVQNLSAAASLQNAQVNGQVEIAQLNTSASVQAAQIQKELVLGVTGAQLEATNLQTAAAVTIESGKQQSAVSIQKLQSDAAVKQTQIEGATLEFLGHTASQTQIQIANTKAAEQLQIYGTLAQQHKLGGSSTGVSQILSTLLTSGQSGPSVIAANQPSEVASSPGAIIGGITSGITSGLGALFG